MNDETPAAKPKRLASTSTVEPQDSHEVAKVRPRPKVTTGKPKQSSWRTIDGRMVDPVDFRRKGRVFRVRAKEKGVAHSHRIKLSGQLFPAILPPVGCIK